MKTLSPSLAALALVGMAAHLNAATIADDLKLKVKGQVQVRGQFGAQATTAGTPTVGGKDADFYNGYTAGAKSDQARFSIRRARIAVEAKNDTGWSAQITIRGGEGVDAGGAPAKGDGDRPVSLYYAYIAKAWKLEPVEIELRAGLDKPFTSESSISSSTYALPSDRPTAYLVDMNRAPGLGVKVTSDYVTAGFDVQNNSNNPNPSGTAATANTGSATGGEGSTNGLYYSARIEASPGAEYKPARKQESYAGAPGTHIVIGLEYLTQADANTAVAAPAPNTTNKVNQQTRVVFGPDLLVHYDGLTALVDYKLTSVDQENADFNSDTAGNQNEMKGTALSFTAAYAFPMEAGFVVEPAARYSMIDLNTDEKEVRGQPALNAGEFRPQLSNDANGSADEITVGVNLYWNGHKNKTQLAYSMYTAEKGDGEASVFTVQHQLTF